MSSGQKKNNPFWDVQVSIANGAAKISKPSLAKLHHEVLEEMGKPPSQELIDYFLGIVRIPEKEVNEYYQYIGKGKIEEQTESSATLPKDLIVRIARGDNPSVLKFRQAYMSEFNKTPSEHLIKLFLQETQGSGRTQVVNGDKQLHMNFAQDIARGSQPTVLNFRKEFVKQFGLQPSEEITKFFLKAIPDSPVLGNETEEFEAKVNFAKTVANGLISTVLQFRQAYEKVYGEKPSTKIIDIFIKNLPRNE